MQISNNNPTNTLTPTTEAQTKRGHRKPTHQQPQGKAPEAAERLILQDPTVCSTTPPPT
ncbi:hypothetical protein Pve01_76180 [Planomonospora venezuelensis]|nr:hypothetical protein Pve01_76180 [Planomonospora venezuelensis]